VLLLVLVSMVLVISNGLEVRAEEEERMALTPSGRRPASCVFGPIDSSHFVVDLGTHSEIHDAQGKMIRRVDACKSSKSNVLPPDGWAAYVYDQGTGPTINSYNGSWTVPAMPADQGTQTLFLFTGLQDNFGLDRESDIPAVTNIIQPVLQFGPSEAGGGTYWALASWYVDSNSNAYYSALTQTQTGHGIQGNMMRNANRVWVIQSIDTNTNQMTTLNIATNTTEPWAFVTLEVYTVSSCNEYPTGSVTFSNLVFMPSQQPSWTPQVSAGCNENVEVNSPVSVTIDF